MRGLVPKTRLYLKRNSATILTCMGAIGVVATSVTAVKATPKAIKLLEQAMDEKGEELTNLEVVNIVTPVYIPSILIGASTIACIFGANILNKRQQAALMSAYALLENSYKEYRNKVEEVVGEETNALIKNEIVKDKCEGIAIPEESDVRVFFDFYTMQYFESTVRDVLNAERMFNQRIKTYGYALLSDFYELLNINIDPNFRLVYCHEEIEFIHEKAKMDDGLEICIIDTLDMPLPPFYG